MIDLGTGVLDMRYENPLALAENIASADLISEGRVAARRELGIAGGRHRRAGRLRNGQAARGARRVRRISGEAAPQLPGLDEQDDGREILGDAKAVLGPTIAGPPERVSERLAADADKCRSRCPASSGSPTSPTCSRTWWPRPATWAGHDAPRRGSTDPAEPRAQYEIRQGRKYRIPEPHQLSGTFLLSRRRTCSFPRR